MKKNRYSRPSRIILGALALGASGWLAYDTIDRPAQADPLTTAKNRHSPRELRQQASSLAGDKVSPDLALKPPAPHVFHEFNNWAVQYSKATPAEQQKMLARGETMVKKRHEQMADLIEKSPQVALDESDALSPLAREALPESLKAQLEQRVNARGDIRVMACLGEDVAPYIRSAIFDGQDYTFYPATEDEMIWPESNRSLLGITLAVNRVGLGKDGKQYPRVDKLMALRKDRVRVLSTEEAAVAAKSRKKGTESVCEVSEKSVAKAPVPAAIETGDDTKFMCMPEHTNAWLKSPAGIAAGAAPDRFAAVGGPGEGSGGATAKAGYFALTMPSTGDLKCIVAKFRCIDQAAYTQNVGSDRMKEMFDELAKSSNKTVTFFPTYIPEDLVLPGKANEYYSVARSLRDDSTAALNKWMAANRKNLSDFRFHIVCVEGAMKAGGGADIGGQYVEINKTTNHVFEHEIGHIVGLPHANLWAPRTINPIGAGTLQEYAGAYSSMGTLEMDWAGFNTMDRFFIRWLPFAQVHDLTSRVTGIYTIYDPDIESFNSNRQYCIRIPRSDGSHYFVEFRPNATALGSKAAVDATTKNGIRILRSKDSAQLDLTPLSAGGARDGALVVGQEFYDAAENLTITPYGKGGPDEDQFFQVQITFGVPTLTKGRTYVLRSREGNLAMGVANSATDNTAAVTRQYFQGSPSQKWVLMSDGQSNYKVINANSGKALTVSGYSTQNMGTIEQYEYVGSNSQRWQIASTGGGYFKLINVNSGIAMSNLYPYTDAGVQIIQYQYQNHPSQHWSFQEVNPLNSGSNYQIMARNSGKVLDVAGSANTDGTPIYQWAPMLGGSYQKWTASGQGGSHQAFTNVGSQKVLEVEGYSTADGAAVQQYYWAFHPWQKWTLEATDQDSGGIWYQLVNVGSGKVVSVNGASNQDGAQLQQWPKWGYANQQWRFTDAP